MSDEITTESKATIAELEATLAAMTEPCPCPCEFLCAECWSYSSQTRNNPPIHSDSCLNCLGKGSVPLIEGSRRECPGIVNSSVINHYIGCKCDCLGNTLDLGIEKVMLFMLERSAIHIYPPIQNAVIKRLRLYRCSWEGHSEYGANPHLALLRACIEVERSLEESQTVEMSNES